MVQMIVTSLKRFFSRERRHPSDAPRAVPDRAMRVDRGLRRASEAQTIDDYGDLLAALPGTAVFFSYVVTGEDWAAEVWPAEGGKRVLPLFTSPDHPRLTRQIAEQTWQDALRMIMGMPDLDGAVIINLQDEHVILAQPALRALYLTFLAESRNADLAGERLARDEVLVICERDSETSPFSRLMSFVIDGEAFTPIFREIASFRRQTEGSGYEGRGVVLTLDVLIPLLADNDRLILNPGDPDPVRLTKADLADALANG